MYNPSLHIATNKPVGVTGKPADARSYYYDEANFVYRPYTGTDEVLAYLNSQTSRMGQFSIIVNIGGTLADGVITGGTNIEYWFKDSLADDGLIVKSPLIDPLISIAYAANYAAVATIATGHGNKLIFVKNDEVNGGTANGSYAATLYLYANNTLLFILRTGA